MYSHDHIKRAGTGDKDSAPSSSFFSRMPRPFITPGTPGIPGADRGETVQMCKECGNPACEDGELCSREGGKSRRKKREAQKAAVKKRLKEEEAWKDRSDYLVDKHGEVRKPIPGASTGLLFLGSREAQESTPAPAGDEVVLDPSSLPEKARGVMGISKKFSEDPGSGFSVVTPSGEEVGGISKANAPWYKMPKWASHNPGMPSAFATPKDSAGKKLGSTYHEDKGVFSESRVSSEEELPLAQRLLVSSAESVRGPGAGMAQVLASDLFAGDSAPSRDVQYGTKEAPGLVPAGYGGSQVDIALTEEAALREDWEGTLANPTGIQTENILGIERKRRKSGTLGRSLSNPDLDATLEHHEADTEELMAGLGFPPPAKRRFKRSRSSDDLDSRKKRR